MPTSQERLAENAVALMASFPDYQRFYKKNADKLSGFPGCWSYVAKVAILFTRVEESIPDVWDDRDWVRAIDYVANDLEDNVDMSDEDWLDVIRNHFDDAGWESDTD